MTEGRKMNRRDFLKLGGAGLAGTTLLGVPAAMAVADPGRSVKDRSILMEYARDTWRSFDMLLHRKTGLPSDNVSAGGERSRYTSPTNIGAYIWSTLAARDLKIIKRREARARISRTLETIKELEIHEPSGQFYNWYDPDSGEKLTTWPVDGTPVYPFASSVDNGWLAAALHMVENGLPELRQEAYEIYSEMDFGFYYDPAVGLIRGGFWVDPPPECSVEDNYRDRGPAVYYTCNHYGSLNTEPRIASYIGIAEGQIPPEHYFKAWRTFPDTCDWDWQEMKPEGETRTYLGVDVYEGHYKYRDLNLVPTWGGSMFEALMVPLLVPEEEWGQRSWGINHPLYVQAQIEHGLEEANYGYWGFSPSNDPSGGYREYGVDAIGLNPDGYTSDQERTTVDYGFGECRPAQPAPEEYGQGVVTPHASFIAYDFAQEAALDNLANLRRDFDIYGPGGFYDAVNVATGEVSRYYLALDQGMIMAALGNALANDSLQRYFTRGKVKKEIKPLLAMEEFTAGTSG